jgi:type IV secretory pathway TraG/TraD family ATPase VirD4
MEEYRHNFKEIEKGRGPSPLNLMECEKISSSEYAIDGNLSRFAWMPELVTARLYPLLTERILRCFNGSDFTARDIIAGKKPVTVYLCIPEKDLRAKSPVIRLVMESLMGEMKEYFDNAPGETAAQKGCRDVLYLIDEARNITLPSLPTDAATVRSRGISIWLAYQDNAQLESQYPTQHKAIKNNMDAKLFYRQNEFETARDIAESVGYRSGFARSQTLRDGQAATEGLSEQAVHVVTPRDINELVPQKVIALFSNRKPMLLTRMDWQESPILRQRRGLPPPPVQPLPLLQEHRTERSERHEQETPPATSWRPDPSLFRRRAHASASNGFRKKQGKTL